MSALTIVQDASAAMGLTQPSTIESSSDSQTVKMLSLLNRNAKKINRDFNWQTAIRQTNFITDGSSEYVISNSPVSVTDFAHLTTPFLYDRTDNRAIIGIGANEYQLHKMYPINAIARYRFRIINNKIQFDDAVPTGHDVHFEYKTKNWVIPAKTAFTLNSDTTYLDEELLTLGLIYKFKNEQGFTYDEEFREYQEYLSKLKDQDKDERLTQMSGIRFLNYLNIPNTFSETGH